MRGAANVQSVDALVAYRAALADFGVKTCDTLAGADVSIQRTFDELKERQRYWTRELQKRTEELGRVRSALSLARADRGGSNSRTGELEIEMHKATRRKREAEEKLETTRRWLRKLPDALRDYEGPARKLRGFLEGELQQGLGVLENKIRALEAYVAMMSPSAGLPGGVASIAPSTPTESAPAAPTATEPAADSQPAGGATAERSQA
jgi:hypothetical protein